MNLTWKAESLKGLAMVIFIFIYDNAYLCWQCMKERLRQQAAGLGSIENSPTFSKEVINIKKENEVTLYFIC